MLNMNEKLRDIVDVVLDKESEHFELLNAAKSLSGFFEKYSDISTHTTHSSDVPDTQHTFLDSGVAISPLDAAICTNEYMRTTKYIRGIFEAIQDLTQKFKDEKIHILYAGSGPYGTLIIPLLSLFDSKKIEVTFLDIHNSSLNSVKNIIDNLGLEDYICEYVQADATTYKSKNKIHLIVTETMKAAFDDEPQVAITLNLLPQLSKDGVFIPNRVVVNFEMIEKKHEKIDGVLHVKKNSKLLCEVLNMSASKDMREDNLITTKSITLPDSIDEKMSPYLTTTIDIYKDNILSENECSLNIPKKMKFDKDLSHGDSISFDYKFGKKPTISFTCKQSDLKAQFHEHGYMRDKEHISKKHLLLLDKSVSELRDELLCKRDEELNNVLVCYAKKERHISRVNNLFAYLKPEFLLILGSPKLLDIVTSLCGENSLPVYESLMIRSLGDETYTALHQDMIHDRTSTIATFCIYLDDVTADDGCVRVVPNTQYEKHDLNQFDELCQKNSWDFKSLVANSGDMLVHDVMAIHDSPALSKIKNRRTIYLEFRSLEHLENNSRFSKEWIQNRKELMSIAKDKYKAFLNEESLDFTKKERDFFTNLYSIQTQMEPANYPFYNENTNKELGK